MKASKTNWGILFAVGAAFWSTMSLPVMAVGGTSIVATAGQEAHLRPGWPEGVGELVNDPVRTDGWNSWFTEWPNDVNQYAMEIKNTADLNRLIQKLAAVKTELKQVRLSPVVAAAGGKDLDESTKKAGERIREFLDSRARVNTHAPEE